MKKLLVLGLIIPTILSGCVFGKIVPAEEKQDEGFDILEPAQAEDVFNENNLLEVVAGSVTITSLDREENVELGETLAVVVGDTIEVSEEGEAILTWFDDSISRLAAGTELTITEADYNPEDLSETHISFSVLTGIVWNKVITLVNPKSEFTSESGLIVAGVRGSVYNLVAEEGQVWVESVEHDAFIRVRDEMGADEGDRIVKPGKRVFLNYRERFEIGATALKFDDIPDEKRLGRWYQWNDGEDVLARTRIAKKNLDRLKKRVGALPGEDGYEAKQRLIAEKLANATEEEKAIIQARIEQLKASEAMVILQEGRTTDVNIEEQLQKAQDRIQNSDLTDEQKRRLLLELKGDIQVIDRTLSGATLEERALIEAKEALRQRAIELELSEEDKAALIERTVIRQQYELSDLEATMDYMITEPVPTKIDSGVISDFKILDSTTDQLTLREKVIAIVRELEASGVVAQPAVIERLKYEPELQKRFLNLSREEKIRLLQEGQL